MLGGRGGCALGLPNGEANGLLVGAGFWTDSGLFYSGGGCLGYWGAGLICLGGPARGRTAVGLGALPIGLGRTMASGYGGGIGGVSTVPAS